MRRGELYWVNLDPTVGPEIHKTQPGLVISPDDMNAALPRIIVAPLTGRGQPLGCRPAVEFGGKQARTLLDQLRFIDKRRHGGRIGSIDLALLHPVLAQMQA